MTIEETANVYGLSQYSPSPNQTITDLVRILYGDPKEIHFKILTRLNKRNDWYNLNPEVPVNYIKKESVKNIAE